MKGILINNPHVGFVTERPRNLKSLNCMTVHLRLFFFYIYGEMDNLHKIWYNIYCDSTKDIGGSIMKETVIEARKRFEMQIDGLKISDQDKAKLKRVLQGIVDSSRGRLFTRKENDFEEYLTIRPNENEHYELCVIERMINTYSGATENSIKTPMNVSQMLEYVKDHDAIIESEVVDAENYQKRVNASKMEPKIEEEKPKSLKEDFKDIFVATIENLPNRTESQKQRAIDVLEAISVVPQNRLYTKREDGYSEAIALRGSGNQFRYYIVKRMSDYAGSTVGRDEEPVGVRGILEYVEENKISIDRELKELRRKFPELNQKKPSISSSKPEFEDR